MDKAKKQMSKIWFIRYGESKGNAGYPTSDPASIPLTDTGWRQAEKVSIAFEKAPSIIVTSKYLRAIQTAKPTIERFQAVRTETWNIHEFTYLSPKKLGQTSREKRQPLAESFWEKSNPNFSHSPGAETFSHFIKRIETLRDRIRTSEEDFIAIFSHEYVTKALLWTNLVNRFEETSEYMKKFHTFHTTFNLCNGGTIACQVNDNNLFFSGILTAHLNQ